MQGVRVKRLNVIADERGRLFEILRDDDPGFCKFGQVYATTVFPGVVKGWHYHKRQTDIVTCVYGMIKLALFDGREESKTKGKVQEFFIGNHNMLSITIPPGVLHGFKGIGVDEAMVVNVIDFPYDHADPDEYRIDPHNNDIPYDWNRKDG